MIEPSRSDDEKPEIADFAEALDLMRADSKRLLGDLLRGISMWGVTSLLAFFLAGACLALGQVIIKYAHPYGALPQVLDLLNISYGLALVSAGLGGILLWRYYSLRTRYSRLFEVARNLR
jgi:hypothetical protein